MEKDTQSQQMKANAFNALHHSGKLLILPNIWDPLGAALLESLGYPAVATASAAVAFSNGYDDGENIPFTNVLIRLKSIVSSVNLPVTADVEKGYASTEGELTKNIRQLIHAGIVGINLEDFNKQTNSFFSVEDACKRIAVVRKVSADMQIPLFINARTDIYIRGNEFVTGAEKLKETLKRGKAYMEAGASGFFPIAVTAKSDLEQLVDTLHCPINVIAIPGIPDFKTLQSMGVARISLGPGFLKIAIKAMKELAVKLKNQDGLDEVIGNDVTSAYLKELVVQK